MPFVLNIPKPDNTLHMIAINEGESLFVLGANGSGKSSLMHYIYRTNYANARRISAHRQTWFSSNSTGLTAQGRQSTEKNIKNTDRSVKARWQENYPEERASIAIYDLIDAENQRARSIANAVDVNNIELAQSLSKAQAPINIINELLHLSNLPIELSISESAHIFARKSGSAPYSIAELSDGERNAILLAANVLTVKENTLILIDEPERHLHRSIISPLLTQLFAKRTDCAFIISTHEIMLPLDNPSAQTLLIRDCTFDESTATAWDSDLLPPETEIDNALLKDILGARRKVLFVEGIENSMDKLLYSLVFPNVTVIAKSSCRNVEYAVSGIRDADAVHWLHAFGIVDNDGRKIEDIEQLKAKGVYAISVFSVHSIYYHPEVQRRIAERQAAVTGDDATTFFNNAIDAALTSIRQQIKHLSERACEKTIREQFFKHLPRRSDIEAATPINIYIDVSAEITAERKRLENLLDTNDLLSIFSRYPIRETRALDSIANRLGFQNREKYEKAVRKLLIDDSEALTFVKSLFGTLCMDIATK